MAKDNRAPYRPDPNAPTPERKAKGDLEAWKPGQIRRANSTQLDWLFKHRHITQMQHEAGNKLFDEWFKSGLHTNRAQVLRERVDGTPDPERSIIHLDHKSAFGRALQAVGLDLSEIVTHVAIHDRPPSECRSRRGYTAPRAKQVEALTLLRLALDRLAEHYGMVRPRHRMTAQRGVDA